MAEKLLSCEARLMEATRQGKATLADRRLLRVVVRKLGGNPLFVRTGNLPQRSIEDCHQTSRYIGEWSREARQEQALLLRSARPDLFGHYTPDNQPSPSFEDQLKELLKDRPRIRRPKQKATKASKPVVTTRRVLNLRASAQVYGEAVRHLRALRRTEQVPISNPSAEPISPQQRTGESAEQMRARLAAGAADFLATFADGGKRWIVLTTGLGSLPMVGKLDSRYDEHGDRVPPRHHKVDGAQWRERLREPRALNRREKKAVRAIRQLLGAKTCDLLSTDLTRKEIATKLGVSPGTVSRLKRQARDKIKL